MLIDDPVAHKVTKNALCINSEAVFSFFNTVDAEASIISTGPMLIKMEASASTVLKKENTASLFMQRAFLDLSGIPIRQTSVPADSWFQISYSEVCLPARMMTPYSYQYWTDVNQDGSFSIDRVKEGKYRLTVYAEGIIQ
jgi:hypothetical protein